ncbi:MAG: PQQ-binding-like beta-propeller repeat protein [Burkholderiales bacterium]|nr:PQQ-binding-like beta-propeller repeat protein [Burkholderiales bacterium]
MNRLPPAAPRLALSLVLAASLAGSGAGALAAAAAPAMFRGGPALAGVYEAPAPRRLLGVRFSFTAGAPIRGTPAVAAGSVYFGSADGTVYALDAASGKERWRVALGSGVSASPCVVDGTVFVTSRDGRLHALAAADGARRWGADLGRDRDSRNYWDFYTSSPVAFAAALYVGSGDGHVRAFDLRSGRLLWSHDAGSRVRSTPAVSDSTVVVGTMSGHVLALDRQSGSLRWRFATEGASRSFADRENDTTSVFGSASIADGVVAIGGRDGFAYGIDLASGALKWKTTHDGSSWILSSAVQDGQLYLASGSAAIVQAADLQSGAERWRFATGGAVFGSPAIAGSVLLVSDFSGALHAIDKTSGAALWRFPLGDRAFSSPVVAGRVVYAAADEGTLYALDVADDAGPPPPPPARYVYWEPKQAGDAFAWFRNDVDVAIRGSFESAGYRRVDRAGLAELMSAQVDKGGRSVVVFAANRVPPALLAPGDASALLRRYLEAGGRIVFLGANPVGFKYEPDSGDLVDFDPAGAARILGLRYPPLEQERGYHVSAATAEGRAWGLRGQQVGTGAIAPGEVSVVLAVNEYGLATSWVKRFGSRGGALVQLTAPASFVGSLTVFHIVAEHGL